MSRIIDINSSKATIADDDNKVIHVPIAAVQYSNPKVGDQVAVYQDGKQKFVRPDNTAPTGARTVNKHLFVWLGCFFFGWVGADRHMRGQHGLGILKLATTTIIPLALVITFVATLFSTSFYYEPALTPYYVDDCDYDDYYESYYYKAGYADCLAKDYDSFFGYSLYYDNEGEIIVLVFFLLVPMMAVSFAGGIWCLVDWIIALVKVYGKNSNTNEISFDERGHYLA